MLKAVMYANDLRCHRMEIELIRIEIESMQKTSSSCCAFVFFFLNEEVALFLLIVSFIFS